MTTSTLLADAAAPELPLAQETLPLSAPTKKPFRLAMTQPLVLFAITMVSTTSVGMRYMWNFQANRAPLTSDADILPFAWVLHHLSGFASGLPFSLTLISILLAHEFGHFFACRSFGVRATLPYLLPAPSLSGSFGAVIQLKGKVRTRAALLMIGAVGPIAGFAVAVVTTAIGLGLSHYTSSTAPLNAEPPLLFTGIHALLNHAAGVQAPLSRIVPHPMLTASWMGLLITAINLIPAGQLDGGHILYAVSPRLHRLFSPVVVVCLIAAGIFSWIGWLLWGCILLMPSMRHPRVPEAEPLERWHLALVPVCGVILLLAGTLAPFRGFSLLEILHMMVHRY